MKNKTCFKCGKNFVPPNRTILWCDDCRKVHNLPAEEVKPLSPVVLPKPEKPKPTEINAWERIEWLKTDSGETYLRIRYWNGLRLSIFTDDISTKPEWWAALRDVRLILQHFRKSED